MTDDHELAVAIGGPARPLSLVESARVFGALRYVELGAFSRLGHAATLRSASPARCVASHAASMGHAWRAAQLADLLPVGTGLPEPGEWTVSPGEQVEAVLAAVGAEEGACDVLHRGLAEAYRLRLGHTEILTQGAAWRTLRRLVEDVSITNVRHLLDQAAGAGEA